MSQIDAQQRIAELSRVVTMETIHAQRRHPRFTAALRHSMAQSLANYAGDRQTSNTLKDVGRFFSGVLCVYLAITGGLTLARVRAHCEGSGLIGPGAAEALIAYLRDIGFIDLAADQPSRREVRLVPAQRLVASMRRRFRLEVEAAAMVNPALGPLVAAWDREDVWQAFFASQARDLLLAVPFYSADQAGVGGLFARNAGPLLLFDLLTSGEADDAFPPVRPVRLSMSALAGRFEVSRIHVTRFIQAGEEAGLFERLEGGRSLRLTPALTETVSNFFAVLYLLVQDTAAAVMPGLGLGDGVRCPQTEGCGQGPGG